MIGANIAFNSFGKATRDDCAGGGRKHHSSVGAAAVVAWDADAVARGAAAVDPRKTKAWLLISTQNRN